MKGRVKTPVIYQSVRYHGWIKVNWVWQYGTARAQTWPTWLWDQWCPAVLVFKLWRMTQRSSLRSILCWVIAWPCLKGKLELQLRNTPYRTVGVDLRVRYLSGQCLTAPRGGAGGRFLPTSWPVVQLGGLIRVRDCFLECSHWGFLSPLIRGLEKKIMSSSWREGSHIL